MTTSSPSCSVQIEFSFPAVPLAQLRNDGSCSIVCQLDRGSGDPGLHLISVRKQPALHLLKSNSHGGLNPSSPYLPLPPWSRFSFIVMVRLHRSDFRDVAQEEQSVRLSGSETAALSSFEIWRLFDCWSSPKIRRRMLGGVFRLFSVSMESSMELIRRITSKAHVWSKPNQ